MQLKCWVAPGEEEAKRAEVSAATAPPPMAPSTASLASSQNEDAGTAAAPSNGPPIYGGARPARSAVSNRYAPAPSLGGFGAAAAADSAGPSLLSGELCSSWPASIPFF